VVRVAQSLVFCVVFCVVYPRINNTKYYTENERLGNTNHTIKPRINNTKYYTEN
jgi:hypothetical protein